MASVVGLNVLWIRAEDVAFHRARRTFCSRNGDVVLAPAGTAMSHLEWFETEGWVAIFLDRGRRPADAIVRGTRYEQKFLGTLGSLTEEN